MAEQRQSCQGRDCVRPRRDNEQLSGAAKERPQTHGGRQVNTRTIALVALIIAVIVLLLLLL